MKLANFLTDRMAYISSNSLRTSSLLPVATLLSLALIAGCAPATKNGIENDAGLLRGQELSQAIEQVMLAEDVKGLAVAIIEDGRISYQQSFGYRNVAQQLPLRSDTIMYGASLTKAAFAYMVLQLVDEGVIALDRPIAEYLKKPLPSYPKWRVLEGDEQWRLLTPRLILSHSTGLANLRFLEPNRDLKFHFTPGQAYAYSGEGFFLLQFVLEEGLGLNVKSEMQSRIFDRFNMARTDMQWREDFATNLADGYAMDGSFEPHDERSNVSASGSMDTTIADQARMWQGMLAGEGLSSRMRAEWIRGQLPIRTVQKFPTIQFHDRLSSQGAAIDLAAGLGVETWRGPHGRSFAKGGHNDWTGNLVICQQAKNRCLVMLANSVRAEIVFPRIAELTLGETGYPWWWTYPRLHKS